MMDMKSGRMYETRDAAVAAGVPEEFIGEAEVSADGSTARIITSGPFKGREYQRNDLGQWVRVGKRRKGGRR